MSRYFEVWCLAAPGKEFVVTMVDGKEEKAANAQTWTQFLAKQEANNVTMVGYSVIPAPDIQIPGPGWYRMHATFRVPEYR
ncbi:MAG: hypothetical protein HYV90_00070 [Candidatus Woesebacteria bacterium]|nr:MAG: hypothetical protein HYV90_00070 [Candidatus Woesebacteria bacterium]